MAGQKTSFNNLSRAPLIIHLTYTIPTASEHLRLSRIHNVEQEGYEATGPHRAVPGTSTTEPRNFDGYELDNGFDTADGCNVLAQPNNCMGIDVLRRPDLAIRDSGTKSRRKAACPLQRSLCRNLDCSFVHARCPKANSDRRRSPSSPACSVDLPPYLLGHLTWVLFYSVDGQTGRLRYRFIFSCQSEDRVCTVYYNPFPYSLQPPNSYL